MPTRKASAVWNGGLKGGNGTYKGETGIGGAYSFGSRFEESKGSNPEELLAAAEAACFSMALSGNLEKNGTPATKVETSAACTVEKVGAGFTITRIALAVEGTVPNIDEATFQRIAGETKETCPVSRALKGLEIQLQAHLRK
jgi:osmotically inducible protein OsmC